MYFHKQRFSNGSGYYIQRLLPDMLRANWSAVCGNTMNLDGTDDFNETIYLPRAVRFWLHWKPRSVATWLVKWFIVSELLLVLAAYTLLGAVFKLGLWTIFFVPFLFGLFLISIRLEPAPLTSM